MTTLRNKQYDPFHVLRTVSTFASEASNTLRRRFRGSPDKVWLQSSMYPDYYLNTFHYQVMTGSAIGTANCTWFDGTMVFFSAVTEACMQLYRLSLSLVKTVLLCLAAGFANSDQNALSAYNNSAATKGIPPWLVATQHNEHDNEFWHTVLQTDGWFSEKSASIYEASTETLFLGRQDAMQRQSLVPLHRFMQARSPGRDTKGDNTNMLEVACGTGRFATFVKVLQSSNPPLHASTIFGAATFIICFRAVLLGGVVIMQ